MSADARELRGGLPKVGKNVTTPVGRARVLSINLLRGVARLRLEHSGEVIELSTDELRNQFGTAVRPAELEEVVEGPIRERQSRLDRDFVAVLTPVEERRRPARAVVVESASLEVRAASEVRPGVDLETDRAEDTDDTDVRGEAGDDDGTPLEGGDDAPRKRRRRGRRGGRRRRGDAGTAEANGESSAGVAESAPAD